MVQVVEILQARTEKEKAPEGAESGLVSSLSVDWTVSDDQFQSALSFLHSSLSIQTLTLSVPLTLLSVCLRSACHLCFLIPTHHHPASPKQTSATASSLPPLIRASVYFASGSTQCACLITINKRSLAREQLMTSDDDDDVCVCTVRTRDVDWRWGRQIH